MRFQKLPLLLFCFAVVALSCGRTNAGLAATRTNCANVVVDKIWSGSRVGPTAISTPDAIFIAYYNAARYMTLAKVNLANCTVEKKILSSRFGGYDLHNYIALAFDNQNILHVSGNMHNVPLVYYRASKAFDISTVKPLVMSGILESSTTYPRFFFAGTKLHFFYRNGGSGNGLTYLNTFYDGSEIRSCRGNRKVVCQASNGSGLSSNFFRYWTKTIPTAIFSNLGTIDGVATDVSAYAYGPVPGPDKFYHFAIDWRATGDVSTNYAVTYVKTPDFRRWYDAAGRAVQVPISANNTAAFAVYTGFNKGLVNNVKLGFTASGKPIVLFTKYVDTPNGRRNGIFATIYDGTKWNEMNIATAQNFTEIKGIGSLSFLPNFSTLNRYGPVSTMFYQFFNEPRVNLNLDAETLLPTSLKPVIPPIPSVPKSPVPALIGLETDPGVVLTSAGYQNLGGPLISLRWRRLPDNNDRAFSCPPSPAPYCNPPPSDFVLDTLWPN